MGSCPPHTRSVRTAHTLMVLSFFTLCAGYAATHISCYGSTVPYTESGTRLLSTSDSLLCLCSPILSSARVTLPCTFHSLILLQADCSFISHNGTFLNTPEGRRGAVTAHQHICSGQKGEKKLLQLLLISWGASLCFSVYRKPRCRAVVQRYYRSCITALVLCMLCTLFIYLYLPFFLSVYICVYFSCAFCYILFYVTARIYCFLLACIMTTKWNL